MIVPRYWAETRLKEQVNGRQATIRRFGWADTSQGAAQLHADQRAREAMAQLRAGEKVRRRERNVPYNGADGMPIREEIVDRQGDVIITRNAYGARCLNVPNVLFADVDFPEHWRAPSGGGLVAFLKKLFGGGTPAAPPASPEEAARARVEAFVQTNPSWHLRLYKTPAGLRVLAMHQTFAPRSPEVAALFDALQVDPVYRRMCHNQQCFRARLSAKPWRIGVPDHVRPLRGTWPPAESLLARRRQWVEHYEGVAQGYAACRFVGAFGSNRIDSAAEAVRRLHDNLCRAESDLPLA